MIVASCVCEPVKCLGEYSRRVEGGRGILKKSEGVKLGAIIGSIQKTSFQSGCHPARLRN